MSPRHMSPRTWSAVVSSVSAAVAVVSTFGTPSAAVEYVERPVYVERVVYVDRVVERVEYVETAAPVVPVVLPPLACWDSDAAALWLNDWTEGLHAAGFTPADGYGEALMSANGAVVVPFDC